VPIDRSPDGFERGPKWLVSGGELAIRNNRTNLAGDRHGADLTRHYRVRHTTPGPARRDNYRRRSPVDPSREDSRK
jgi:hypothetical protein